jgi:quercetin dioxygenase-like cupin family protein
MKYLFFSSILIAASLPTFAAGIEVKPAQASSKGPSEFFSGSVLVTPLFVSPKPSRTQGASVSFEPKARSAWHSHPLGQTLIVTEGEGFVSEWKGKTQFFKKGDVIWTPPGVKHCHGARPDSAMTHIAIQEEKDGKVVQWMEKVSDEEYLSITKGSKHSN